MIIIKKGINLNPQFTYSNVWNSWWVFYEIYNMFSIKAKITNKEYTNWK